MNGPQMHRVIFAAVLAAALTILLATAVVLAQQTSLDAPEGPDEHDELSIGSTVPEDGAVEAGPSPPSGFSIKSKTDTSATLEWSPYPPTIVDRYRVDYKTSSTTSWTVGGYRPETTAPPSNKQTLTISGLTCNPSTTYDFRILSRDPVDFRYGEPSSTVSSTFDCTPSISLSGLASSIVKDSSDSFTVSASNLVSTNSYTIRVTTSNSDVGFNSTCSDRQEDFTVPSGSTSSSNSLTLYACNTTGGTVTASLRSGNSQVDSASQSVTVTTPTPTPSISLSGLASSIVKDSSDSFTVSASNLVSTNSYTIRVNTSNSDIGFNSTCSDRQEDFTVPSGSTSSSNSLTLYACNTTGGTVTASLRSGNSQVDSASQSVTVTTPTPTPSISLSGLASSIVKDSSDSFTVSASNLVSTNSYTIRVNTSNSDIGFNSTCSDRQEDFTVPSGSTSSSNSLTLYACNTTGGTVTASLRSGNSQVDSASQSVTVTTPTPTPSISLSGLASSIVKDSSDSFTVSASNLVSTNSYTIRVNTSNSDVGFNSTCSDRQEDFTVPSGSTSSSNSLTLYACDTTGGTVTASLRSGNSQVDSASQSVTVTTPTPTPSISLSGLASSIVKDSSDSFTVSASNLVSTNSYTIRVTTSNSDIGFNSTCSDRQEDFTVPSGSTSSSNSLTLYACNTTGGTVTASLRSGNSQVDSASQSVTVTTPTPPLAPPAPDGLSANGDAKGDWRVDIWWDSVNAADTYSLRFAVECPQWTLYTKGAAAPCATTPGPWTVITGLPSNSTPLNVINPVSPGASHGALHSLNLNVTYRVQVSAVNSTGSSQWSLPYALVHPTIEGPKLGPTPSGWSPMPYIATAPLYTYLPKNSSGVPEFEYVACAEKTRGASIDMTNEEMVTAVERWVGALEKNRTTSLISMIEDTAPHVNACKPPASEVDVGRTTGHNGIMFTDAEGMDLVRCTDSHEWKSPSCWLTRTQRAILQQVSGPIKTLPTLKKGWLLLRRGYTEPPAHFPTLWNEQGHDSSCDVAGHAVTHEVGHALGVGHFDHTADHPELSKLSIMSTGYGHNRQYCGPEPYDVVTLTANYQSR